MHKEFVIHCTRISNERKDLCIFFKYIPEGVTVNCFKLDVGVKLAAA